MAETLFAYPIDLSGSLEGGNYLSITFRIDYAHQPGRKIVFSTSGVLLVGRSHAQIMKTNTQNLTPNHPVSLTRIVRNLDEGPDYQPDWRWLVVHQHLSEIHEDSKTNDASVKLTQILDREKDEIIRQTLQFHCGDSNVDNGAVGYALRANLTPLAAIKIKAMVVAGCSIDQIATKLGTDPAKIEFFEKLFFDVRRYLDKRDWLETICSGERGHRLLQVALVRAWAGLEELNSSPKGPRDLARIISVLLGRSQKHVFDLEFSNAATSEKDLQLLLSVLRANYVGYLPVLEDAVEPTPLPDTPGFKKFAALNAGERDRVRSFLIMIMDAAARKAAEQDLGASNGSNDPPAGPKHAPQLLAPGNGPDDQSPPSPERAPSAEP